MARRRQNDLDASKVKLSKDSWKKARKLFSYMTPYKWHFILGMLMLALGSLVALMFPIAGGEMVNIATGNAKYSEYNVDLNFIGKVLIAVLLLQGIAAFLRVYFFAFVSEKGMGDVRKELYQKLIALPITFFEKNRVGEITSRSTADLGQIQSVISVTLAEFVRQIIILIAGFAYLFYVTPRLTLLMVATFPVVIIAAIFFGRFIRKISNKRQKLLADSNVVVEETMQSISVVKAFTNEYFESQRYGKNVNELIQIGMRYAKVRGAFFFFIISLIFGAIFYIIWSGAWMVQNNQMNPGDLVTFIAITAMIGGAIGGLSDFYAQIQSAVGATERVMDILDMDNEVDLNALNNTSFQKLNGNITYQNVSFSYPTRKDLEILKGIDLSINSGQKIALVGTSGAGKSTIVQLLMRFYNLESGSIQIDGKSIADYDISQLRKNIAIVPQEVLLFGGTIRENIAYGNPNASEDEIIEAAQKANCWDFIQTFPEGLETIVGERGVKLSGGQRQRVAIARAILKNPSILILDEATSSLDAESEKVVQEALNTLMEGRTSIIIAHRLATIRDVDCIYVLDGGLIVEQGSHEELTKGEGGLYEELAKLQFEVI